MKRALLLFFALALTTPSVSAEPAQNFSAWLQAFRAQALAAGIKESVLSAALRDLTPDERVLAADRAQPEFVKPVWDYLASATETLRVKRGQALMLWHAGTLAAIESRFQVEREALIALWGMEGSYGSLTGSYSVIRTLATLAFDGRRRAFAQEQLLAALSILQNSGMKPAELLGSSAGAMGQVQFMPITYLRYAVDFDGNQTRDIWRSTPDALASAANLLRALGWRRGLPWVIPVTLPAGFAYQLAAPHTLYPLHQWQQLGVEFDSSATLATEPAQLYLPAGHSGAAFLVLENFRALMQYNQSAAYALGVWMLAERLKGTDLPQWNWPRDLVPLSRDQIAQMQRALLRLGLDAGEADGVIGQRTRQALRDWQITQSLPADGYATNDLLQRLLTQSPQK